MMTRIGRNDPCHCGSGIKYKNCHLKIEQEEAKEARAWESAARFLRRDFIALAREERFAESFAAGLALFFRDYHTFETAHQMSEPETLRFFDWFVHDHCPDDRPRLIEIYHEEKGDMMDDKESHLLTSWLSAGPVSAYVLTDATGEGKQTLHLKDMFTEIEYMIPQSGGPGRAESGDVLIARLLPFRDQLQMSGATGYLPADEAADLKPFILQAWADAQEDDPDIGWEAFLRQNGYLFAHYELEAAKKAGRPPVARLDPDFRPLTAGQILRQVRGRR